MDSIVFKFKALKRIRGESKNVDCSLNVFQMNF